MASSRAGVIQKQIQRGIEVETGSGNVYDDLGFRNAEHLLLKSQLAAEIQIAMEDRQLTPGQAANIMGIPQARLSDILRGKLARFTLDRLFRLLLKLDSRVRLVLERDSPQGREAHGEEQVA